MSMPLIDLIRAVREIISNPEHWTHGAYARDSAGKSVYPCSERAVSWCLLGAYQKVMDGSLDIELRKTYQKVILRVLADRGCHDDYDFLLTVWQDRPWRTHAEVIQLLDWTIEKLSVEPEELVPLKEPSSLAERSRPASAR